MDVYEAEGRGGQETQKADRCHRAGGSEQWGSVLTCCRSCHTHSPRSYKFLRSFDCPWNSRDCFFMGSSVPSTSKEWEGIDHT